MNSEEIYNDVTSVYKTGKMILERYCMFRINEFGKPCGCALGAYIYGKYGIDGFEKRVSEFTKHEYYLVSPEVSKEITENKLFVNGIVTGFDNDNYFSKIAVTDDKFDEGEKLGRRIWRDLHENGI